MTTKEKTNLCRQAVSAANNSHSPYSGFKVGAALLCEDGSLFLGTNIENASYSATNCAERVAIQTAVANGKRNFKAMAIAGGKERVGELACPPCGVCRQVLSEFCKGDFILLLAKSEGFEEYTLSQLLPLSFNKDNL